MFSDHKGKKVQNLPGSIPGSSGFFATRLLFAKVGLYLVPEDQHPQLPVGRLVHGLGLHAHLVLLGGQFVHAVLLVPQVEEPPHRCTHHNQIAVEILAVQVHVLPAPASDVQVKATYIDEVRTVLTGHPKAKVSPKSSFLLYDQLLLQGRHCIVMAIYYARIVLTEKDRIKYLLPWLRVQPARVEEFRGEVDIDITEKEKDVASFPEAGSDIKSLSPRKLSIQLDECEVPEVGSFGSVFKYSFDLIHFFLPKVNNGEMNSPILLDAHLPEVVHELPELVYPLCQWHDNVDECVAHVELFLFYFHDRAKGSKQDKSPEFMLLLPFERKLIQSAFILLCAVDPFYEICGRERALIGAALHGAVQSLQGGLDGFHQLIPLVLPHRFLLGVACQARLQLVHLLQRETVKGHCGILRGQLDARVHLGLVHLGAQEGQQVCRGLLWGPWFGAQAGSVAGAMLGAPEPLAALLQLLLELCDLPLEAADVVAVLLLPLLQCGLIALLPRGAIGPGQPPLLLVPSRGAGQHVEDRHSTAEQHEQNRHP